ncbi:MAG: hypothetical protein AB1599_08395 [Planctomycetota bacterium]
MMRVKRNNTAILRMKDAPDTDYVRFPAGERVAFIWELTAELWSLKEPKSAQQRLQRNVAVLVKPQG